MDPVLYKAATSGSINMFLEKATDPNFFLQETREKNSALHLAVKFNQKQFAEKIIDLHPQLMYQENSKGDTPLHIAARLGCLEITKLIMRPLDAESREVEAQKELLSMVNLENDTALHDAVRNDHIEIVKLLIKEESKLTLFRNNNGDSPLFVAVDRRLFDIASHILKVAPSYSYRGRNNMNVLHAAIIRQHSNSFMGIWARFLVEPIIFICVSTHFNLTRPPLRIGNDFMSAFIEKCPTAIREADDQFGWTPLHYAAYLFNTKAVELLLKNDRDIAYMKDKEGMSALHVAAKEGHVNVMKKLIEFCPETCELLDCRGRSALHVAVESGKASAVKFVLKTPGLEGLINEQDKKGNTPLHLAAVHGHYNILNMLADDSRVDKGAMNKEGLSAFEIIPSQKNFRRFQTAWITRKVEKAGGPPSLKGVVIEENTKTKNIEMKEQDQEIKGTTLDKKRELVQGMAMKDLVLDWGKDPAENEDSKFRRLKDTAKTHILVATIIATVTFTAGFTMPGGYENKGHHQGTAVLSREPAFGVFMIADTLAFACSTASMTIHFWGSMERNYKIFLYLMRFATVFTYLSIISMAATFLSGTYVVLTQSLGLANVAIGFCCFCIVFCIGFLG